MSVPAPVSVEPETLWILPTGEIVQPGTSGAKELEKDEVDHPPPRLVSDSGDEKWLPKWYMTTMDGIAAEKATLKKQYEIMERRLEMRVEHLKWRYEDILIDIVQDMIDATGKKKKSIDFLWGRAGFRTTKRQVVEDPEHAIMYLKKNVPGAVKVRETVLVSEIPKGMKVPGVRDIVEEKFFTKGAAPK